MFLLICLLRLSLITASCLSWCQVHPRRSLRIEAYRKSSSGDDSLHSEDINGNNFRILMVLYEAVENGDTYPAIRFKMSCYSELFDNNGYFSYSPAQWAILNNSPDVLSFFLINSLLKTNRTVSIQAYIIHIFNELFINCIQWGKFESFKILWELFPSSSIGNEDYLSLAAQHHVNEQFWQFLFNKGVVSETAKKSNLLEYYGEVLTVAVRFNNIIAAKMLIERGAVLSEALEMIMARNRQRLLENVINSNFCEFKDEEGLGLLHYAAKHSNDPDMISLIIDKCKRVDTNLDTLSGWTPLELCLNRMDSNVEKIAKILVLNGADVFTKNPEGKSPIETIIKGNFNCLFSFLLGICFQNDSHMIEFIDICVRHKSWTRLDEILIKRPDLIASLKIQNVSVYTFTVEDAPITFRFCLENKLILQDENEFINWLVLKNSNELVKIALCYISYDVFRTKVLEFCKMEAVSEEFIDNMDKYLSDSK